jgi:hypothetical protein
MSCPRVPYYDITDKQANNLTSGPTYVKFQSDPSTLVQATYYQKVCGPTGLVRQRGLAGAENASGVCSSVLDYRCYWSDCRCLGLNPRDCTKTRSGCASILRRITLPAGVGVNVYNKWDCEGKTLESYQNFGNKGMPQTVVVGTGDKGEQALEFFIVSGYACAPESGLVFVTDPVKVHAAYKASQDTQRKSTKKMVIGIGAGVLVILLIALVLGGHRVALETPNMTNDQILTSVGLRDGKAPSSNAVKGSIRDVLQGNTVKLVKSASKS